LIKVKGISKLYGKKEALKNISFDVGKGEILGFLGPNGAGKTTTMKIITGYISPTSGKVSVNGIDIFEDPLKARGKIGYLPENSPLYSNMKVDKFLKFICELKDIKTKKIASEIERVIKILSLTSVRNRLIGNLSKGYKQRVGLAQAIIGEPKVLILDEPTSGLDPKQIIEIRKLIKELSREKTIIICSHILTEINMIAERLLIINDGKIIAQGTLKELSRPFKEEVLRVKIEGDGEKIKRGLLEIPSIKKVENLEGYFDITINEGNETKREIFFKMANLGFPILEIRKIELTLEEIFLKSITKEASLR
jgi:ABC-2 type transport system ATP-binding protein